MTDCVSLRCVWGVVCVMLASFRMVRAKPSDPVSTYPPSINCSTVPGWVPERRSLQSPTNMDLEPTIDQDFEELETPDYSSKDPVSPSRDKNRNFQYLTEENEYFDYYYEDSDHGLSDSTQPPEKRYHQLPPGLNKVAKLKLIRTPRRQPPEYMLELYDRLSKAHMPMTTSNPAEMVEDDSQLEADIVRSFPNINKEDPVEIHPQKSGRQEGEGGAEEENKDEELAGSNTRHHTLVFNITSVLNGEQVSRAELRLYTLVEQDRNTYVGDNRVVRVYEGLSSHHHLPPVASRHVYGHSGGWEAFDVTTVVQQWVRKGTKIGDGVHVLEVKIDSLFQSDQKGPTNAMDIDVDPLHSEGPLLVVFSRDTSWQLREELQTLIDHEPDHVEEDMEEDGDVKEVSDDSAAVYGGQSVSRTRRSSSSSSRTASRRYDMFTDLPKQALRRVRRDKRKRNSCRRKTLYVDFQDINWHQWIIAPSGYMAFECVGKCYVPIGAHLSPTKHAIIQALVHAAHPKMAARACCVPTKLDPISILYLDDNNVITYKYKYDGMVVAECGCR